MTPITDKIKQLPDGRRLMIELPMQTYEDANLTTDDLKALVSDLERKTRALERIAGVSSGYPCACEDIAQTVLRGDEK